MKKNASRLLLEAFFFIYYDQVLNNLYSVYSLNSKQIDQCSVTHYLIQTRSLFVLEGSTCTVLIELKCLIFNLMSIQF